MKRLVALLALVLTLAATAAVAQDKTEKDAQSGKAAPVAPAPRQLDMTVDGRKLTYEAVAGFLPVAVGQGRDKVVGNLFHVDYRLMIEARRPRPVTFLFNGGPGAAAVFLNLGAVGPKRIVFAGDGGALPPPVKIDTNSETWLGMSDLVFVDPMGTGYSRPDDRTDKDAAGERKSSPESAFLGASQDVDSLAEFIRLWLTRNQRWGAPVYLVGESYGGYRVAELAAKLQADKGIVPMGIALVSPAIDFGLLRGDRIVSPLIAVPTMAAVALAQGRSPPGELAARLAEAEAFAVADLSFAYLMGGDLPAAQRDELAKRLSALIGLPPELVARYNLRVPSGVFAKQLLRDKGTVVGRYDGGITAVDANPESGEFLADDPSLVTLIPPYTAAFNQIVRSDLNFETDTAYEVLNGRVNMAWDWRSGLGGGQGYLDASDALRRAIYRNPAMRVWIVHGAYDLVTPYFGSAHLIRQMYLDPKLRQNLRLDVLPGGHMMYGLDDNRQLMRREARRFFYAGSLDR